MRTIIILFVLLPIISGCAFHTSPEDNVEFKEISKLQSLQGLYLNKSDPYMKFGHLSQVIWGNYIIETKNKKINSDDIQYINVSTFNNHLVASAIINNCIIYSKKYIYGKDIKITNGTLILNEKTSAFTRGQGDLTVGPSYEKQILGLDAKGHGKYRRDSYFAGLILFMIPAAVKETLELKYEKIDNSKKFNLCKNR